MRTGGEEKNMTLLKVIVHFLPTTEKKHLTVVQNVSIADRTQKGSQMDRQVCSHGGHIINSLLLQTDIAMIAT
jgi:hypothetical protein